jgi:hypothetical protein
MRENYLNGEIFMNRGEVKRRIEAADLKKPRNNDGKKDSNVRTTTSCKTMTAA